MSIHRILPKPARTFLRTLGSKIIPRRWKLPVEVRWAQLTGRLEDEMLILDQISAAKRVAIDIGANRGFYSYVMSRLFEQVEAFEANPEIVQDLRHYAAPNVRVHTVALSSEATVAQLYIPTVNGVKYPGWASFDPNNLPQGASIQILEVQTVTLDAQNLNDISLIKIDVEGHEMNVLNGAIETIRRNRPAVIIEVKKGNRLEADAFFSSLSYKLYIVIGSELSELRHGLKEYLGPKETFVFKPA